MSEILGFKVLRVVGKDIFSPYAFNHKWHMGWNHSTCYCIDDLEHLCGFWATFDPTLERNLNVVLMHDGIAFLMEGADRVTIYEEAFRAETAAIVAVVDISSYLSKYLHLSASNFVRRESKHISSFYKLPLISHHRATTLVKTSLEEQLGVLPSRTKSLFENWRSK